MLDGYLVPIPASRVETRLRREQAQLEQQKREIEQTRQQTLALLAQFSSVAKNKAGRIIGDRFRLI
ncbi:hypothetical protein [Erwinia sp. 9145]|uniref:hypothetical protein n=1 Tax=Erwinia sp. 9145 TaxID=1500895 RepID=UPI00068EA4A5|nr:hypothetical protein [Erwinia sp. 9145]